MQKMCLIKKKKNLQIFIKNAHVLKEKAIKHILHAYINLILHNSRTYLILCDADEDRYNSLLHIKYHNIQEEIKIITFITK